MLNGCYLRSLRCRWIRTAKKRATHFTSRNEVRERSHTRGNAHGKSQQTDVCQSHVAWAVALPRAGAIWQARWVWLGGRRIPVTSYPFPLPAPKTYRSLPLSNLLLFMVSVTRKQMTLSGSGQVSSSLILRHKLYVFHLTSFHHKGILSSHVIPKEWVQDNKIFWERELTFT